MPAGLPDISAIPMAAWAGVLVAAVGVGQYIRLRMGKARNAAVEAEADEDLRKAFAALQRHAAEHDYVWPTHTTELVGFPSTIVYRYVPGVKFDGRLILLYDGSARHKVLAYPTSRTARVVCLVSGRKLILTDEQLEKLVIADNALRENLGLDALPFERGPEQELG